MAAPTTLLALLASLQQSLTSATEVAPKLEAIERPKDGISLLDVKNELLLSYLQNLVFLILLKLRNAASQFEVDDASHQGLDEAVRAKLVELRLYLEKGARPLEEKLRFSIERFLRVAEDAQRENESKGKGKGKSKGKRRGTGDHPRSGSSSGSDEEEEDSSDEDDDAARVEEETQHKRAAMSAAPNFSRMMDDVTTRPSAGEEGATGAYRPPKRDRHLMETTQRREKADRRPQRSHTMEEFINSELSAAPLSEPSVGTTIVQGGRKTKTTEERKEEDERRDYEESNFVRLPKESKKDRAKKSQQAGRNARMMFGGEAWHDLGEGVDRIDRLTKRKGAASGSVRAMLEKSRKRGMDTTDGPRGSGHAAEMGERYRKRVKVLEGGRRDRGKNR